MEIDAAIKRIIQTGKVEYGSRKAIENLSHGKAKLVVVSSDCPKMIRSDVEHYSKLSKIPVVKYRGTSLELGEACGKPFLIANLTVLDSGDVDVRELISQSK